MPPEIKLGNSITPVGTPAGTFQAPRITRNLVDDAFKIRQLDQRDAALEERERQNTINNLNDIFDRVQRGQELKARDKRILEIERGRIQRDTAREQAAITRFTESQKGATDRAEIARQQRQLIEAGRTERERIKEDAAAKRRINDDIKDLSGNRLTFQQAEEIHQQTGMPHSEIALRYREGETFALSPADQQVHDAKMQDMAAIKRDEDYSPEDIAQVSAFLQAEIDSLQPEWQKPEFVPAKQFDTYSHVLPDGKIITYEEDPKNPGKFRIDKVIEPKDPTEGMDPVTKARLKAIGDATRDMSQGVAGLVGKPEEIVKKAESLADARLEYAFKGQPVPKTANTPDATSPSVGSNDLPNTPEDARGFLDSLKEKYDGDASLITPEERRIIRELRAQGLL